MKTKFLLIIIVLLSFNVNAQVYSYYSPVTTAYGFNAIAIDAQDTKWLGAAIGIYKFDGVNWTNYTTSNIGLINNSINTIIVDKLNNKWIGTINGVSKFDGSNWTNYSLLNYNLRTRNVKAIAIDYTDNNTINSVWLGGDGFLINIQNTTFTDYSYIFPIDSVVNSLAFDKTHNLWVGTQQCGIYKFNGTNWTHTNLYTWLPSYASQSVVSIAVDSHNNKWFGLLSWGVFRLIDTAWTYFNVVNNYSFGGILQVTTDKYENVYFANQNGAGFAAFDGTVTHLFPFCLSGANQPNVQYGVAVDTIGNKWIASDGCGLVELYDCTPSAPSTITGPLTVAPGQNNITYHIATVANANFYHWTLPSGFSMQRPDCVFAR